MVDDDLTSKFELAMPSVTMDMILDNIEDEKYYSWPGTTVTSCLLVLKNGYSVVGVAACAHAGNFNIVLGQELARKDALRQVWPLMGYELRTHLHAIERPNAPNPNPHIAAIAESAGKLADAGLITTDEATRVTPGEGAL